MADLLALRTGIARKLAELDARDLERIEAHIEAVRCQARVRALFTSGAQVPPGLLAVAVAEMPADGDGGGGGGAEQRVVLAAGEQYMVTDGRDGPLVITLDRAVASPTVSGLGDVHIARRCPTCRDVVVAGVCRCDGDVEDAIARALQAEADVGELEAVTGAAPPAQLERTLVIVDGLPDIGGPCAVVARGGYVRGVLRGWTTLGAALVDVDGVLGVYPEARRVE